MGKHRILFTLGIISIIIMFPTKSNNSDEDKLFFSNFIY